MLVVEKPWLVVSSDAAAKSTVKMEDVMMEWSVVMQLLEASTVDN